MSRTKDACQDMINTEGWEAEGRRGGAHQSWGGQGGLLGERDLGWALKKTHSC